MSDNNVLLIRQAKLYDVPALARIEDNSFAEPWSAKEIANDITETDRAYVAVAMIDDERAGYADMWLAADEAQIYNIVIDEPYRGRGIGKALMEHMISRARDVDCRTMTLEVRAGNDTAIAMYHDMGFRDVSVRRKYYRDNNEDALLMDLDLGVSFDIEL